MKKPSEDLGAAPDFEATDVDGRPIRLADYRGKNPVVIVLMRGFA